MAFSFFIPILLAFGIIIKMCFFIKPNYENSKDGRADYRYVLFNRDFWMAGLIFIGGSAYVAAVLFCILHIIFFYRH
jgi:hypothetical protein